MYVFASLAKHAYLWVVPQLLLDHLDGLPAGVPVMPGKGSVPGEDEAGPRSGGRHVAGHAF